MSTIHLLIFCAVLGGWLLLSKKIRKDVDDTKDAKFATLKYYGMMVFIFSILGGFLFFFNNSSVAGSGQINAFTEQLSAKNYRLNAEMTFNPNEDMLHYFKKEQYKITSIEWPNGGKETVDCIVRSDSRDVCDIGGQSYYVEVSSYQSDDNGSNE